jgi:chitodextrinase
VLVGELRKVLGSDFEAVDESSLMLSPDSGQAWQGNSDLEAPTAPTRLVASVVSSSRIDLSWDPSTDNTGVEGYLVYRNGTRIATTPALTYQSAGLTPSTSYTYLVAAYDAAGNVSAQSNAVTKTTLQASSTVFSIGDSVRTTGKTNVRSAPSAAGAVLGTQPKSASGKIVAGPVYWDNQWWWRVDFTRNPDGWVPETKLKKVR